MVQMKLSLPENIKASDVSVTAKDRDVIIKSEYKDESDDRWSQFYYYRRSTLPENTDMANLKVTFDDNQNLVLNAPILSGTKQLEPPVLNKNIPIEADKQQQQQKQPERMELTKEG